MVGRWKRGDFRRPSSFMGDGELYLSCGDRRCRGFLRRPAWSELEGTTRCSRSKYTYEARIRGGQMKTATRKLRLQAGSKMAHLERPRRALSTIFEAREPGWMTRK